MPFFAGSPQTWIGWVRRGMWPMLVAGKKFERAWDWLIRGPVRGVDAADVGRGVGRFGEIFG